MVKTETEVKKLALALLNDLARQFEGRKAFDDLMRDGSNDPLAAYLNGQSYANGEAIELVREAIKKLLQHA
jgi:hypothetical protein